MDCFLHVNEHKLHIKAGMPNNVCVILPGSPTAQPYAIQQGKALAMTVIDLFCDPQLRQEMKKQFKKDSTYEHYS